MLVTIGFVITTAIFISNVVALADLIDEDTLPAPIARAWMVAVVLFPGIGAASWFACRSQLRSEPALATSPSRVADYPSPQDLKHLHEQIDRFRSPRAQS